MCRGAGVDCIWPPIRRGYWNSYSHRGSLDKVCGNGKKMADNKQEFDIQEKQLVNTCEMDQHGTSKQSPKICSVGSMMQYNPTCNLSNIPLPKI